MKFSILVICCMVLIIQCETTKEVTQTTEAPKKEQHKGDSLVKKFYGDYFSVVKDPDSAVAQLLNPEKEEKDSAKRVYIYAKIGNPVGLSRKQKNKLIEILENRKSYSFDSTVKNCTFFPDVAFQLSKKEGKKVKKMNVFVALYCDVWMIQHDSTEIYEDSDSARVEIVKLLKDIYPNDKYIQQLKEKMK